MIKPVMITITPSIETVLNFIFKFFTPFRLVIGYNLYNLVQLLMLSNLDNFIASYAIDWQEFLKSYILKYKLGVESFGVPPYFVLCFFQEFVYEDY